MICKILCFGHVPAWFLSKHFYILGTCIIFHEIMFFKELLAFRALYFLQGAFLHSWRFYFIQGALFFLHSAFLILHSAFLLLHSALFSFLCESSLVYHLQLWARALFYFPSTLSCSYFLMWSAYLLISGWDFWWLCVSISILILYKTFRFWPLV